MNVFKEKEKQLQCQQLALLPFTTVRAYWISRELLVITLPLHTMLLLRIHTISTLCTAKINPL